MPLLRLLSTSLLASAFILPAAAQSAANPPAQHPRPQAITADPTTPAIASLTVPAGHPSSILLTAAPKSFHSSARLQKSNTLLAQTHAPCYTLRVYNFTPRDLQSPHPQPSSETDCTPASSVKLKSIEIQAIKK